MYPLGRFILTALAALVALLPGAQAQNLPRLGYVYPAGGQRGTSFQVTLGGQFLAGPTNVFWSAKGISAKVLEYHRPLNQRELNQLREELRLLQEKRTSAERNSGTNAPWTAVEQARLREIRNRLALATPRKQANPALAESVQLQVTIAAETEPGDYELRLQAQSGLSNPLKFCVGTLPEIVETPPAPATTDNKLRKADSAPKSSTERTDVAVQLPCMINGRILPGEVDRYRFKAGAGTKLVLAVEARRLIPYLSDAVPGWFQAALTVYDPNGKEVQFADHFEFRPDPVLYFEVPRYGEYAVEIRDSLYRGREDFVYRLTLGEVPFITSIFPLGGRVGDDYAVNLSGWNLPETNTTVKAVERGQGVIPVSVRSAKSKSPSNCVPFACDTLPELNEHEPNDSPIGEAIVWPAVVNGRIDKPGDVDCFAFKTEAGGDFIAEVYARRLDSPLDATLELLDSAGKRLAFNDDSEDKGAGLVTHQADSRLSVHIPRAGSYTLVLRDAQGKGGPDYSYRLRLSAPMPDFALRVVPSTINVRAGASTPITVYALRRDGFTNAIELALVEAPEGFKLSGGKIPAGQEQARVTLSAPRYAEEFVFDLKLAGRSTIKGQAVSHEGVPADDLMQAFAYHHLVPATESKVAVAPIRFARGAARLVSDTPIKIPVGGLGRVIVAGPLALAQLELDDAPDGIELEKVTPRKDGVELTFSADEDKVAPGFTGNLIVDVLRPQRPATKGKPQGARQRVPLGTLPAIPFEVVPR